MDAFDHTTPFVVEEGEYGALLINEGTESNPSPRYVLGCQSSKEIVDTTDLAEFGRMLRKLPQGARIMRYESCSVPRAFGLSAAQVGKFEQSFSEAGLLLEWAPYTPCYCPHRR